MAADLQGIVLGNAKQMKTYLESLLPRSDLKSSISFWMLKPITLQTTLEGLYTIRFLIKQLNK